MPSYATPLCPQGFQGPSTGLESLLLCPYCSRSASGLPLGLPLPSLYHPTHLLYHLCILHTDIIQLELEKISTDAGSKARRRGGGGGAVDAALECPLAYQEGYWLSDTEEFIIRILFCKLSYWLSTLCCKCQWGWKSGLSNGNLKGGSQSCRIGLPQCTLYSLRYWGKNRNQNELLIS